MTMILLHPLKKHRGPKKAILKPVFKVPFELDLVTNQRLKTRRIPQAQTDRVRLVVTVKVSTVCKPLPTQM